MAVALLASATAVTASIVVANPHANTVATQVPEFARHVTLTATADPISLIEALLALPPSVAQELIGTLVPNAPLSPAISPAAATPQDLVGGLGGLLTGALSTVWNDGAYLASIPLQIGVQTAWTLVNYGVAAAFNPDLLFSLLTSYIPNYIQQFTAYGLNGFINTTTQFLAGLAGALGGLLPAAAAQPAAANVSKVQLNSAAAVPPSISHSVPSPQNLIGGLGNVVSSAVSMVANDVAYAVNLPLAVAVPVVLPLVVRFPYSLSPQFIAGLLTTNLPFAVSNAVANTVNGIVSQAGQFVSSLGGLASAATTPLAAASVPKVQSNLIKVSKPAAALSAPNSTADSTPDKAASDKKSDKADADKSGTDRADSGKTKSDKGGKHRKPSESGQAGGGQPDTGAGKTGETKSGNSSHDGDGPKHASDTSGSNSHATGDGQGNAGSHGGSGGHRGSK